MGGTNPVWIESIRVEGGMLDGLNERFSPGLNVLIGGRGTGKSSIIQLLRFCLGATSLTEQARKESVQHAFSVLGDGRVTAVVRDGQSSVELSRTAQDVTYQPKVDARAFVLSQTEIENVGMQAPSRLRLIDGFAGDADGYSTAEDGLIAQIRAMSADIAALIREIDELGEKVEELPHLREQLREVTGAAQAQNVSREIKSERRKLAEITPQVAAARVRFETLSRSYEKLDGWMAELRQLVDRQPLFERWPEQAASEDALTALRGREQDMARALRARLEELSSLAADLGQQISDAESRKTGLENRARDIRQAIEKRMKGASEIDRRIGDLSQRVSALAAMSDLLEDRAAARQAAEIERRQLLDALQALRQGRSGRREQTCRSLSEMLGPELRLSLLRSAQLRDYLAVLSTSLKEAGLKASGLPERIARAVSPCDLALAVEQMNATALEAALRIAGGKVGRICEALRGSTALALITAHVEDDIRIELRVGNDYRPIASLSMGQRCAATLPIIMAHSNQLTILDQPEDHLDNAFIVGTLVKALGARASDAQTIVATHNPNIPVLGGADRVIHMDSDGTRCFVKASGTLGDAAVVEAIATIMEGGPDAFRKRAAFYNSIR
jgi:DNA repair exonuclease SbcCD ATPase subunit